ncbi:DUF805 domain-containing protein [Pseudomonas sp. 21LCFQ010]|uniref:DUF805 domain-containing protein n=1 Tax=Pseudomonas sp. 21LCFQ010 TaxID=2957506 RepID=UPI0020977EC4|nr:DUF805 domain-containing protein [Pseudomonas sp. 21LCFQ010]MCO8163539.1 DUF805 domain-containing protein [Pseudomonas sp. 21LCFQ010]
MMLIACRDMLQFRGRTQRRNFLYYQLFYTAGVIALFMFESDSRIVRGGVQLGVVTAGFIALNLVPGLAITYRRLHDADFNGLWFLVTFIPLYGPLFLLMLCLSSGSVGVNSYGPCPRRSKAAESKVQSGQETCVTRLDVSA